MLRPNIVAAGEGAEPVNRGQAFRWAIPGDIAATWSRSAFSTFDADWTRLQKEERDFYRRCSSCRRTITQINREGAVDACTARCGFGSAHAFRSGPAIVGGSAFRE